MQPGTIVKLSEKFKSEIRALAEIGQVINGCSLDTFRGTVIKADDDLVTVEAQDGEIQFYARRNIEVA